MCNLKSSKNLFSKKYTWILEWEKCCGLRWSVLFLKTSKVLKIILVHGIENILFFTINYKNIAIDFKVKILEQILMSSNRILPELFFFNSMIFCRSRFYYNNTKLTYRLKQPTHDTKGLPFHSLMYNTFSIHPSGQPNVRSWLSLLFLLSNILNDGFLLQ